MSWSFNYKVILIFSIYLTWGNMVAQRYDIPTLYFKNGDTLKGERHAFLKKQVQFSKTLKSKPVKYDFEDIIKVDVMNRRNNEVSTYVPEKIVGGRRKAMIERRVEGYLSHYRIKRYSGTEGNFYYDLYLKRKSEDAISFVGTENPFKFNFRKKITGYLNDCQPLVAKINAKEFKRKHMNEIVQYYNENCVKK